MLETCTLCTAVCECGATFEVQAHFDETIGRLTSSACCPLCGSQNYYLDTDSG